MALAAILTVVSVLTGCTGEASPALPETGFSATLAERLQRTVEDNFDLVGAPGLVVMVAFADGSSWSTAAGLDSRTEERLMQPFAHFRVGSLTKTFNAALVHQLVAEGVWQLDDPVNRYVTDFVLDDEITLRRLLNHTSGVFNFTDDAVAFAGEDTTDPVEIVKFALKHGLTAPPGAEFRYSNTAYFITALALQAVTGKPFHTLVRERLLDPWNLRDTWLEGREAIGLALVDGHLARAKYDLVYIGYDANQSWAAGALVSNGVDLCHWGMALYHPADVQHSPVTPAARAAMETLPKTTRGDPPAYGAGANLTTRGGRPVIGHTGSTMGFQAELFIDRANGACVTVLANDFLADPWQLSIPIWKQLDAWWQEHETP